MLTEVLEKLELSLHPSSDLAVMIREVEWLGSFGKDASQPDAAFAADRKRSLTAFPLYEQANRLAIALNWAAGIPGIDRKIRGLRKGLNRLESQDEAAQDDLFEIDIAYRLFKRGFDVEFAEPDIVINYPPESKFAIACKRPRTIGAVQKRIRHGANQIRAQELPGIVAIGMESIIHSSDDPEKPKPAWYVIDYPDQIDGAAEPFFVETIRRTKHEIQRSFEKGVSAVFFCGVITALCTNPNGYYWSWQRRWVEAPRVSGLMADFDDLIFGKQAADR